MSSQSETLAANFPRPCFFLSPSLFSPSLLVPDARFCSPVCYSLFFDLLLVFHVCFFFLLPCLLPPFFHAFLFLSLVNACFFFSSSLSLLSLVFPSFSCVRYFRCLLCLFFVFFMFPLLPCALLPSSPVFIAFSTLPPVFFLLSHPSCPCASTSALLSTSAPPHACRVCISSTPGFSNVFRSPCFRAPYSRLLSKSLSISRSPRIHLHPAPIRSRVQMSSPPLPP